MDHAIFDSMQTSSDTLSESFDFFDEVLAEADKEALLQVCVSLVRAMNSGAADDIFRQALAFNRNLIPELVGKEKLPRAKKEKLAHRLQKAHDERVKDWLSPQEE